MPNMDAHPPHQERSRDGQWQSQFMDTVGDGTGSIEMAIDASAAMQGFCVTAPPGHHYFLTRMIGSVQASGRFSSAGYGTGVALTNGIEIWRQGNPADPLDFDYQWTYQHPVKYNIDWGVFAYDSTVQEWSNQYQTLLWRYTITKDAAGGTFWMKPGQSLCCRVNDNLLARGVLSQHIRVAFISVPEAYVNR